MGGGEEGREIRVCVVWDAAAEAVTAARAAAAAGASALTLSFL